MAGAKALKPSGGVTGLVAEAPDDEPELTTLLWL
jgi:hypothetical protein